LIDDFGLYEMPGFINTIQSRADPFNLSDYPGAGSQSNAGTARDRLLTDNLQPVSAQQSLNDLTGPDTQIHVRGTVFKMNK
jgi:hypothetical protein